MTTSKLQQTPKPVHSPSNSDDEIPNKEERPKMSIRRIIVIGLGNPGSYQGTYHSIGHMVLESFQKQQGVGQQPPFTSERLGKKAARSSLGDKYALVQSPTLMNVSGPWVAKAYKEYLANEGLAPQEVGLVVVHDDLEEELGVVKVRQWSRSHRGHNGVKSVLGSLPPHLNVNWARISVGIGRPVSRDQSAVSDFVLSKVPAHAKSVIEQKASRGLVDALVQLEKKWEREGSSGPE
ncbi:Peptidyl-tRNA hydrolase [Rhypophila sp. PSN 637]